jgi:hypothetical protein
MAPTSASPATRRLIAALALATAACTGTVPEDHGGPPSSQGGAGGGSSADPKGGGKMPPSGPSNPPAPASASAAVAPMRRLTRTQYRNTIRDLLGVADAVDVSALPGDDAIGDRFHSNTVTPLQAIDVGKYADAGEAIATRAVANLAALVPCDARAPDPACVRGFIESFGKRAYRRPLTSAEADLMQAVYGAGGDFAGGIRLLLAAVLQSPKFLYLPERVPATAGKIVGVDGWALASRLSYFLLDSMPDQGLFAAAEAGKLATADQVATEAARLMGDARFRDTLATFHEEWLQLDTLPGTEKDPMLYASWTPALREALGEETRRFVQYVFTEGDSSLGTLLTAPFSFLSGPLYQHYGVTGSGATWTRVDLPASQRAGLLTQAGLLSTLAHDNRTSFILRGKMVREALFCQPPLTVPPDVPAEPKVDPNASARARSEQHRQDPACASCHDLFDPIGFAFENYDAAGRWRTTDSAGAIDARVTLSHTRALDGKSAGNAIELVKLLAGADEVRDCVARQWMRFALGRDDATEDEPSLAVAVKAFERGGGKLPDLVAALVRSDSFRFQKVAE